MEKLFVLVLALTLLVFSSGRFSPPRTWLTFELTWSYVVYIDISIYFLFVRASF